MTGRHRKPDPAPARGPVAFATAADLIARLTPSADVPACLDEDPGWQALMALAYPEPAPADDEPEWWEL